ncbi:MAG TPA: hypothetical protein VGF59_06970, partial [Bryobacteraceae bacterium]
MYLIKTGVEPFNIAACIVNVVVTGLAVAALAMLLQRRLKKWIGVSALAFLYLAAMLLPLNAIRAVAVERFGFLRLTALTTSVGTNAIIAIAVVAGIAIVVLHRVLMRAIPTVLLILCFLVPLNLVRGLLKAAAYDPRDFDSKPLAARLPQPRRTPRLVWVIFDEWDARLTFRDRIPSLKMPELDRFEAISLHAGNAYPPSSQTGMSLPALTTGLLVRDAKPQGPDDLLLLRPEPNPSLHWHAAPTIFSEARAAGYNVGVVGFYHPYCRMFNGSLSECSWWPTAL